MKWRTDQDRRCQETTSTGLQCLRGKRHILAHKFWTKTSYPFYKMTGLI